MRKTEVDSVNRLVAVGLYGGWLEIPLVPQIFVINYVLGSLFAGHFIPDRGVLSNGRVLAGGIRRVKNP